MKYNVGIYIFPDIETLDFCGPLEVFSAACIACDSQLFSVYTFADNDLNEVKTINGLRVIPDYSLEIVPQPDILIWPGGNGSRRVIENKQVMQKLQHLYQLSTYTFSVCSGARIPAILNLLDGKEYCTHHSVYEDIQHLAPTAIPSKHKRFADNGKLLTSAGVAAGIDLSFHLLEKVAGRDVAEKTAQYMEYPLLHREGTFTP
jgi:transcriptional regulator GlxA family with amidase domain